MTTKISNRARAALASAGYAVQDNPAISALVAFAAQNPGLEPGNYYSEARDSNGRRAFAQESRAISADWRWLKSALQEAAAEGVKDADVIAEGPHAFSGRLRWAQTTEGAPRWSYCTGQYWPTEYRKAAATLLEYATRRARRARPPAVRMPTTIAELRALNKANGGCWFDAGTMRFHGTTIASGVIRGRYFITRDASGFGDAPRKFTVRSFDATGDVDTVGEPFSYNTKADAIAAIPRAGESEVRT